MNQHDRWYLESSNPRNFIIPQCLVCGKNIDGIVEAPGETHLHVKCFRKVKYQMRG